MIVKKIEEYGRLSVQEALHLPVDGVSKGWENHTLKALIRLINKGDEHGKTERLLQVALKITAPRLIWAELDTYMVGVTPGSSTSTMYTLIKTLRSTKEAIDLIPLFASETGLSVILDFYEYYLVNADLSNGELLPLLKYALPEGFLQTRVRQFSYQTLRRIHKQRRLHRLRWWQDFLKELIPQLNEQELIKNTWEKL